MPHEKFPGSHEVVTFGSEASEKVLKFHGSACSQHSEKTVDLYCKDCSRNVCIVCYVSKHKAHDCHDISEVYEEFKRQVIDGVNRVSASRVSPQILTCSGYDTVYSMQDMVTTT